MNITRIFIKVLSIVLVIASTQVYADNLTESLEIQFPADSELVKTAQSFSTPVEVFEYVTSNIDFALYQGTRSGSINAFLGKRGNDVDTAAVLIAMYRSLGIPSRYVVGTIQADAEDVANLMGVANVQLAKSVLRNAGIQHVVIAEDESTISLEHVWVEVLLPYGNYRGAGSIADAADADPNNCAWVSVSPSFKQYEWISNNINLHDNVPFDFDAYYHAIKNDDSKYINKNPADIFDELALDYLKENHPGTSLEDVIERKGIIPVELGIIPASLPFQIIGDVRRYDSMAEHDAAVPDVESKVWAKKLTVDVGLPYDMFYSIPPCTESLGSFEVNIVELATKRLTSSTAINAEDNSIQQIWRLDNEPIPGMTFRFNDIFGNLLDLGVDTTFVRSCVKDGVTVGELRASDIFTAQTPIKISLTLDGAPDPDGADNDRVNTKTTYGIAGGYYLLATGGETSNWSQVHRAASKLLDANDQYPIVFNSGETGCDMKTGMNCTPYIDENGNGYDATDTRLIDNKVAQDDLTGGLLDVAAQQYFVQMREKTQRMNALNKTRHFIDSYLGFISAVDEVEYIDGTAFSVLPGGLLIDAAGIDLGEWRYDQPEAFSNKMFELNTHIGSSLEHETWQQLTGYDAVSTVRGLQIAAKKGAALLNPKKNLTEDNLADFYQHFGFANHVPSEFTPVNFELFGDLPSTWTHENEYAQFEYFRPDISISTPSHQLNYGTYTYRSNGGLYGWTSCVNSYEDFFLDSANHLTSWPSPGLTFCDGSNLGTSIVATLVLMEIEEKWHGREWYMDPNIIDSKIGKSLFDFFDRAQGFVESENLYRIPPIDLGAVSLWRIMSIRNNIALRDLNQSWMEYVLPDRLVTGDTFRFYVHISRLYDTQTNALGAMSMSIANESLALPAGGGYVDGSLVLNPSRVISADSVLPSFNNEVFNSENLVSQTNNDLVKTPSTSDPVSTVTGNMYHDETDFTIKGRGLDYVLTRSYNSSPARSDKKGAFGYGWAHSYGMTLTSNDYGDCPSCDSSQSPENDNGITSSITYTDERGGEHTYLVDEADFSITNPPGEFDALQLDTPSDGQYTLKFRNGVKYIFIGPNDLETIPGGTARLHKIIDPYGNELSFIYTNDNLTSIKDNLGLATRTGITLTYNADNCVETVTDWTGRTWVYSYTDENLTQVTNPESAITYTYHPDSHLLNEIILPEDRNGEKATVAFSYYQNNKTFNYTNILGETEFLDYDLYSQRTRVTDPRGFVRMHHYDTENGALLKLKEPDGAILRFKNNENGLRYKKIDGLGYETAYSYVADPLTNEPDLSGPASNTWGNVTLERDAAGNNTEYEYDYNLYDQLTRVKDKKGNERIYTYYSTTNTGTGAVKGKLEKAEAIIDGRTVTLESRTYYADGNLKQKTEYIDQNDPDKNRVTDYIYQDNGLNLQSMTVTGWPEGESYTVSYTWDDLGRKRTETLARKTSPTDPTLIDLSTTYDYDSLGRVTETTDSLGNIRETVYDANGKVYQETVHYKLNETEYDTRTYVTNTYDAADRLIKTTDLDGKETHYEYDKSGNLIEVTDANGHTTRYEYDAMNRQTAIIDANGNRTETVYDLAGRVVQSINANGNITAFEYDALGRKTKDITPLGFETHYEYDNNGNLTHLTDANALAGLQPKNSYNATIYNEYDEFNRLEKTVDARDGETRYTYDLLGNMTGVTDAEGRTTTFVYDGLGRLRQVIDPIHETPEDKTTSFTYDEAGNRLSQTDRTGRVTEYTYDELNRIKTVDLTDDDITIRYDYNSYGDPSFSSVDNFVHTNQYDILMRSFDDLHRPTARNDFRFGVGAKNMSWDYDAVGNIRTKTGYEGDITEYQYDSANRLVAMRNQNYLQASYHYDPAGRLLDRILSNQAKTSYKYDDDNRLTQLKNTSAGDKYSHTVTYTHDNIGNILTATDASGTITYTYDALYRLTGADYPGTADDRTYTYDGVGNRLTLTTAEGTLYYLYNNAGNRLDEVRQDSETGPLVYSFVYDDNGNCIEKRDGSGRLQMSFDYDQRNRMTAVQYGENAEPLSSSYYNADGYRTAKDLADGDPRRYYLEGESIEMVYTNGQSTQFNPKSSYLRGVVVDEIVNGYDYDAQGDKTNFTFHHDHLQSVTGLTGHNGDEIETVMYAPFGEIINTAGTGSNDLGYTGRELDPETGMYYYRARYYDPKIGRFLGEDPLGFEAGVNFYTYVLNNPINFNDPEGKILAGGFGIAGGILLAKGIALGVSYLGIQSATHFAEHLTPAQLPEDPVTLGNRVWSVALEANRVQMQVAMELSPLDRAYDILGVVWGKELMGTYIDGGNFVIPDSGSFERSITGLLVSQEMKYSSLGDYYNSNAIKGIGTFFDIVEAGLSIKGAIDNTNITRAWEGFNLNSSNASGGFVLYPNKPNTNMMRSVYSK